MDVKKIRDDLRAIEQNIDGIGYRGDATLWVNLLSYKDEAGSLSIEAKTKEGYENVDAFKASFDDNAGLKAAMSNALKWVTTLPKPDDARRKVFLRKFGQLIDEAREIGMEIDFINPLTEAMKKLSENVIEDQTGIAAE